MTLGDDTAFTLTRPAHTSGAGTGFLITGQAAAGTDTAGGLMILTAGAGIGNGAGGAISMVGGAAPGTGAGGAVVIGSGAGGSAGTVTVKESATTACVESA